MCASGQVLLFIYEFCICYVVNIKFFMVYIACCMHQGILVSNCLA